MPQRKEFYELLAAHSDRVVAGANAVLRLMNGLGEGTEDIPVLVAEVNLNEQAGDKIKYELIRLLHQSFTTPINRDQIHTLTMDLDRVVDSIQSVANSIATHHIEVSTSAAREMASLSADACIRLHRAVVALEGRERVQEIVQQCEEVDQIESRAAEVMRQAITRLFENEGDEAAAWHAMKMRGFYFMQEAVLDHCKRAARTLEEILLENA